MGVDSLTSDVVRVARIVPRTIVRMSSSLIVCTCRVFYLLEVFSSWVQLTEGLSAFSLVS